MIAMARAIALGIHAAAAMPADEVVFVVPVTIRTLISGHGILPLHTRMEWISEQKIG
jgi:hypothetical protein